MHSHEYHNACRDDDPNDDMTEIPPDLKDCQNMFDRFMSAGRVLGKTFTPEMHFEMWTAFKAGWQTATAHAKKTMCNRN